jgi:hypothetical protein
MSGGGMEMRGWRQGWGRDISRVRARNWQLILAKEDRGDLLIEVGSEEKDVNTRPFHRDRPCRHRAHAVGAKCWHSLRQSGDHL